MRAYHASLTTDGPILVGTVTAPVALVMAPPLPPPTTGRPSPAVARLLAALPPGESVTFPALCDRMREAHGIGVDWLHEVVHTADRRGLVTITRGHRRRADTWVLRRRDAPLPGPPSCTTCAHYRPGEAWTCPDEAAKWGLSWGDEEATEPPPGTPPCPGRMERDG